MAKKKETKATEVTETKVAETETKAVEAEVKAEPKKAAPAKKATAAKAAVKEPVIKCTIEFNNKNTAVRSIVDSIYEAEGGKENIQTLDVYIQPENNVAYYVVNGNEEGKSVNF